MTVLIGLCFTSCKTFSYKARSIYIANQNIKSTPTVVDVQVDLTKRITYEDKHYVKYQSSSKQETEKLALNHAQYNCIIENDIDVVVDPIYSISFNKNYRQAKVKLTGYAGYYKNARTLYEDVKFLEKYSIDDIKKYILFNNPDLIRNENVPINITFPSKSE